MQTRNLPSIEIQIAKQCAPVCMGIKPSNLLNITKEESKELFYALEKTGLNALYLCENGEKQVYLLYRQYLLKNYLRMTDVILFLRFYGYNNDFIEMLKTLKIRFGQYFRQKSNFPHEIGAFLGYPIIDVKDFIKCKGRDGLFTGYWKVYHNPENAKIQFAQYNTVKREALKAVKQGVLLSEFINKNPICINDKHFLN